METAKQLFVLFENAKHAQTEDEREEAMADLRRHAQVSVPMAIAVGVILVQIERPLLIPVFVLVSATSIVLFLKKLF